MVKATPTLDALSDAVEERTVRVTIDRRTDQASEVWVGRRNDWSGRRELRARLLAAVA